MDVHQEGMGDEVERLVGNGASEPGSLGFAALAEAQRRAGRPEEALRIAEEGLRQQPDFMAGRVALGLALIDLERLDEARSELSRVLDAVPDHPLAVHALEETAAAKPDEAPAAAFATPFPDLAEAELEEAFEEAEADRDSMLDANRVAAATLEAVEADASESGLAPAEDSPFATETVAGLLESQGHGEQARELRDVIQQREEVSAGADPSVGERARLIATLERWLANLGKGSR